MDRAGAIIIVDGRVALIERQRGIRPELYFVFPGGGIESSETAEQALVREVSEELGLDVGVGPLVATVTFRDRRQLYYVAYVVGGEFGTGNGPEMSGQYDQSRGSYRPVWKRIQDLLKGPVYPRAVCQVIVDAQTAGWPVRPVDVVDPG
jgi:8-oxo-dGTP diphosphatase